MGEIPRTLYVYYSTCFYFYFYFPFFSTNSVTTILRLPVMPIHKLKHNKAVVSGVSASLENNRRSGKPRQGICLDRVHNNQARYRVWSPSTYPRRRRRWRLACQRILEEYRMIMHSSSRTCFSWGQVAFLEPKQLLL